MNDIEHQLGQIGKGLVQVNLRLSKLLAQGAPSAAEGPELEVLFDLVDAVERTLAQPVRRSWWPLSGPRPDLTGLRLALDQTLERLAAQGVEPAPTSGAPDPRQHHVIELDRCSDPALDGQLSRTHRSGWVRRGDPTRVLRTAQVSVWRSA